MPGEQRKASPGRAEQLPGVLYLKELSFIPECIGVQQKCMELTIQIAFGTLILLNQRGESLN